MLALSLTISMLHSPIKRSPRDLSRWHGLGMGHTYSTKVGRDGPPHANAAPPQALADGELDVEERDPLKDQGDEIGNEEGPCKDTG